MKTTLLLGAALALSIARPARAHRLDEYLQATTISLSRNHVRAQLGMTPGVAVFPALFAAIDADADGTLSNAEQRAYAQRVLRDLSLAVDGTPLPLRLVDCTFADLTELREGRGIIRIDFDADVPAGARDRRLTFENRHQRTIAEYLVNALVPRDPAIQIVAQHRSYDQSSYRLDYAQSDTPLDSPTPASATGVRALLGTALVLLLLVVPLALLARRTPRAARVRFVSRIRRFATRT